MLDLSKIRTLCAEKGINLKDFADKIGLSEAGLFRMIRHNSTKPVTLNKIAKYLEVPVEYFNTDYQENMVQEPQAPYGKRSPGGFSNCEQELLNTKSELIAAQKLVIKLQAELLEAKNSNQDLSKIISGK